MTGQMSTPSINSSGSRHCPPLPSSLPTGKSSKLQESPGFWIQVNFWRSSKKFDSPRDSRQFPFTQVGRDDAQKMDVSAGLLWKRSLRDSQRTVRRQSTRSSPAESEVQGRRGEERRARSQGQRASETGRRVAPTQHQARRGEG